MVFDSPPDELFRLLVKSAPAAMIITNAEGVIQFANSEIECIFGYPDRELIGRSIELIVPQRLRKNHEALRQSFLAHPVKRPMGAGRDLTATRRDGSEFPVEIGLAPIETANGILILVVVLDITARKEKENSSETRAVEGEARVQKLYAARLSNLGNILAGMANAVSQPLSAVAAYLTTIRRILQKEPELRPDHIEAVLDRAAKQVLRASQIMSHLRQFTMNGESNKTIQSLHELIRNSCEFTDAAANTHVGMTLQLNATADRIIADRVQIEQVLTNLLRNAPDPSQECERRALLISTSLIDGGMIRTDISDTSAVAPVELRGDPFEPFIRTKTYDLGIGMSVSQAILEAHHGKLWVASNARGGTAFSFMLPLLDAEIERLTDETDQGDPEY